MRKFTLAVLIAASLIATAPTAHAEGYVHHGQRPCTGWQYDLTRPATRTTRGPRLVTCVFTKLGLTSEIPMALYVANRETGNTFDPNAYNPSGCGGLFQHMLRYWLGRKLSYLPKWLFPRREIVSWANPLANTWVAARMVAAQGWDPWS